MKTQLIAIAVLALLLVACATKTDTVQNAKTQTLGVQESDVTPIANQGLNSAETEAYDADLDAIDKAFK
ncbi:MAG: hypothetical protein Q7K43_00680 [Candidatus Woesearchaeota archaeon]|nr:hypothetical protein [Candidatus Woesearchaeota archaeon]